MEETIFLAPICGCSFQWVTKAIKCHLQMCPFYVYTKTKLNNGQVPLHQNQWLHRNWDLNPGCVIPPHLTGC